MTDTTTRPAGFRYIDIDWRDDTSGVPVWCLRIDGELTATAPVGDTAAPPFALTEGIPFVPQYHSAESAGAGQPDSWIYRPARTALPLFWPLLAAAVAAVMASIVWRPALILAIVLIVAAVALEARK